MCVEIAKAAALHFFAMCVAAKGKRHSKGSQDRSERYVQHASFVLLSKRRFKMRIFFCFDLVFTDINVSGDLVHNVCNISGFVM